MRTVESIKAWLESLSDGELISVWNEYQSNNRYEGEINYNDDEFFEIYFSKAIDAVRAVSYGDYRYTDEYVKFNGYRNLESFDYLSSEIDFDELAENILENESDYSYLDGLDDYDEEDEEDEEDEKHDEYDYCVATLNENGDCGEILDWFDDLEEARYFYNDLDNKNNYGIFKEFFNKEKNTCDYEKIESEEVTE